MSIKSICSNVAQKLFHKDVKGKAKEKDSIEIDMEDKFVKVFRDLNTRDHPDRKLSEWVKTAHDVSLPMNGKDISNMAFKTLHHSRCEEEHQDMCKVFLQGIQHESVNENERKLASLVLEAIDGDKTVAFYTFKAMSAGINSPVSEALSHIAFESVKHYSYYEGKQKLAPVCGERLLKLIKRESTDEKVRMKAQKALDDSKMVYDSILSTGTINSMAEAETAVTSIQLEALKI